MSPSRRVKSAEDAIRLTKADLQRAVSCVTDVQLAADRLEGTGPTGLVAVTFRGVAARAKVAEKLWISISMNLEPARDSDGGRQWRTHTRRYSYSVFATETGRTEYLSYDFHPPAGVSWPHVHINGKADWLPRGMRKRHLATGRMTVEHFVTFLIDEFGVEPRRRTWERDLKRNLDIFRNRRTW